MRASRSLRSTPGQKGWQRTRSISCFVLCDPPRFSVCRNKDGRGALLGLQDCTSKRFADVKHNSLSTHRNGLQFSYPSSTDGELARIPFILSPPQLFETSCSLLRRGCRWVGQRCALTRNTYTAVPVSCSSLTGTLTARRRFQLKNIWGEWPRLAIMSLFWKVKKNTHIVLEALLHGNLLHLMLSASADERPGRLRFALSSSLARLAVTRSSFHGVLLEKPKIDRRLRCCQQHGNVSGKSARSDYSKVVQLRMYIEAGKKYEAPARISLAQGDFFAPLPLKLCGSR